MAQFAILKDDIVVDTIMAETLEIAQSVYPNQTFQEVPTSFPINTGMRWNGTTFVYPETETNSTVTK